MFGYWNFVLSTVKHTKDIIYYNHKLFSLSRPWNTISLIVIFIFPSKSGDHFCWTALCSRKKYFCPRPEQLSSCSKVECTNLTYRSYGNLNLSLIAKITHRSFWFYFLRKKVLFSAYFNAMLYEKDKCISHNINILYLYNIQNTKFDMVPRHSVQRHSWQTLSSGHPLSSCSSVQWDLLQSSMHMHTVYYSKSKEIMPNK